MAETAYEPRLKTVYRDEIRPALTKEFGYANQMEVPRVDKIVLNMGVGEAVADSKKVTSALADLALIAGTSRYGTSNLMPFASAFLMKPARSPTSKPI